MDGEGGKWGLMLRVDSEDGCMVGVNGEEGL